MEKLSAQDVIALLKESAAANRWAHDQLKHTQEKLAAYERLEHARKLASRMDDEMRDGASVEETAHKLASSGEDLVVLGRAIELRTQDPKLASIGENGFVADSSFPGQVAEGGGRQAMENWLMSDISPLTPGL